MTTSLNDLNETPLAELEAMYGLDIEDKEYYTTVDRGRGPHATRAVRPKQPVTVVKEIPHCAGVPAFRARWALSRPAPGRDFSCCVGIPKSPRGRGHGRNEYF